MLVKIDFRYIIIMKINGLSLISNSIFFKYLFIICYLSNSFKPLVYKIKYTSSHVINNLNLYEIDCRQYYPSSNQSYYTHIWCVLDLATSPIQTIFPGH